MFQNEKLGITFLKCARMRKIAQYLSEKLFTLTKYYKE